jgi:hypothetical protein
VATSPLLSPSDSIGISMLSSIDANRFAIGVSWGQRMWRPVRNSTERHQWLDEQDFQLHALAMTMIKEGSEYGSD